MHVFRYSITSLTKGECKASTEDAFRVAVKKFFFNGMATKSLALRGVRALQQRKKNFSKSSI